MATILPVNNYVKLRINHHNERTIRNISVTHSFKMVLDAEGQLQIVHCTKVVNLILKGIFSKWPPNVLKVVLHPWTLFLQTLCIFLKNKANCTNYPMDLIRNVQRNTKITVLFNLRLTKGGGVPPLENFSLSPKNRKESDLRHLGNLNYIFCGHFDEKKSGVPTSGGVKVSRQRWWVRGGGW